MKEWRFCSADFIVDQERRVCWASRHRRNADDPERWRERAAEIRALVN
jgi:hypothetical protein